MEERTGKTEAERGSVGVQRESRKQQIAENPVLDVIWHRRSIRRFADRQIEEEILQEILDAGLYAPCAGGRQGVIFAVSQDREVNERLGKIKRATPVPAWHQAGIMFRRSSPASPTIRS